MELWGAYQVLIRCSGPKGHGSSPHLWRRDRLIQRVATTDDMKIQFLNKCLRKKRIGKCLKSLTIVMNASGGWSMRGSRTLGHTTEIGQRANPSFPSPSCATMGRGMNLTAKMNDRQNRNVDRFKGFVGYIHWIDEEICSQMEGNNSCGPVDAGCTLSSLCLLHFQVAILQGGTIAFLNVMDWSMEYRDMKGHIAGWSLTIVAR